MKFPRLYSVSSPTLCWTVLFALPDVDSKKYYGYVSKRHAVGYSYGVHCDHYFKSCMTELLRRLKNSLRWRWRHYSDIACGFICLRWCLTYNAWRWRLKRGGRPHGLAAELVVSLTSYPPRFGTLAHTLKSLWRQNVKADRSSLRQTASRRMSSSSQ